MMATSTDLFQVQQVTRNKFDGYNYHILSAFFELYIKAQGRYSHLTLVAPVIPIASSTGDNKALKNTTNG